jgi:hypothetical protein
MVPVVVSVIKRLLPSYGYVKEWPFRSWFQGKFLIIFVIHGGSELASTGIEHVLSLLVQV